MLSESLKEEIQNIAEKICIDYPLENLYFVQILGKRRHYLGGCGKTCFSSTKSYQITDKVAVFWQGNLPESTVSQMNDTLLELAQKIEIELSS